MPGSFGIRRWICKNLCISYGIPQGNNGYKIGGKMASQVFGFLVRAGHFHRWAASRRLGVCLLLLMGALVSGCALPATFQVLDVQTNEPVTGAVAVGMWFRTKTLFGLPYTYTAKVVETETDAEGYFTLPATFGRLALQRPNIIVYKRGYVGWSSSLIYLGCNEQDHSLPILLKREGEDFSIQGRQIYLEQWKAEYTFRSHNSFLERLRIGLHESGANPSRFLDVLRQEGILAAGEE
jgi:hypothetical protein